MSTSELKETLTKELHVTYNEDNLTGVYRLLELETRLDDVFVLSDQQRNRLSESLNQIEKDEYITDENLNTKIDKWLSG